MRSIRGRVRLLNTESFSRGDFVFGNGLSMSSETAVVEIGPRIVVTSNADSELMGTVTGEGTFGLSGTVPVGRTLLVTGGSNPAAPFVLGYGTITVYGTVIIASNVILRGVGFTSASMPTGVIQFNGTNIVIESSVYFNNFQNIVHGPPYGQTLRVEFTPSGSNQVLIPDFRFAGSVVVAATQISLYQSVDRMFTAGTLRLLPTAVLRIETTPLVPFLVQALTNALMSGGRIETNGTLGSRVVKVSLNNAIATAGRVVFTGNIQMLIENTNFAPAAGSTIAFQDMVLLLSSNQLQGQGDYEYGGSMLLLETVIASGITFATTRPMHRKSNASAPAVRNAALFCRR